MSFEILYVCTGNICRSVLAERLSRQVIEARLGPLATQFVTASAGTEAAPGRPMHPYVREIIQARLGETSFASQRLTPALVGTADVVLAATTAERDRAIAMLPAALGRTFTIKEFVRLAGHAGAVPAGDDSVERARRAVQGAQRMRGRVPYVDPVADDIPDPRPTRSAFENCAGQIAATLTAVLDALGLGQIPPRRQQPAR
jgi:protein-tyrosine phosphatase